MSKLLIITSIALAFLAFYLVSTVDIPQTDCPLRMIAGTKIC